MNADKVKMRDAGARQRRQCVARALWGAPSLNHFTKPSISAFICEDGGATK